MKTCKRILSLLLVAVMLLGVLPVQAVKADFNSEISYEPLADSGAVKVEHDGKTTYYATLQKAFDGFAPTNYEYGGRPLREFCVSVFRQNQEYHVFNVHDGGLFPLSTSVPEG